MTGKVLITGGSGYFGSLLRDRLCEMGLDIRIFDIVDTNDRPAEVEFFQGDIRDRDAISDACRGVGVVYHNVALVPLAKDRRAFWEVNYQGTQNLLDACRDAGVAKVVNTSSSAVYGVPARNPVIESDETVPIEDYGKAKLAGERLALRYSEEYGLDVTIIRPRTILGHGRLGIFQILYEWVSEGRRIPVLGRGDNLYQFVHADDLADACIRAGGRPGTAVFNVGAGQFGTMRETLEALCEHAGTGSSVYSIPMSLAVAGMKLTSSLGIAPLAPYHWLMYGRSMYFDISKAQNDLDWSPGWSNNRMICHSYDWYLEHREEVLSANNGSSPHRSALKPGVLSVVKRFF